MPPPAPRESASTRIHSSDARTRACIACERACARTQTRSRGSQVHQVSRTRRMREILPLHRSALPRRRPWRLGRMTTAVGPRCQPGQQRRQLRRRRRQRRAALRVRGRRLLRRPKLRDGRRVLLVQAVAGGRGGGGAGGEKGEGEQVVVCRGRSERGRKRGRAGLPVVTGRAQGSSEMKRLRGSYP